METPRQQREEEKNLPVQREATVDVHVYFSYSFLYYLNNKLGESENVRSNGKQMEEYHFPNLMYISCVI